MGLCRPYSPLSPTSTCTEMFWPTCLQSSLQTSSPTHKYSYTKFQNPRINLPPPYVYKKIAGWRGSSRFFFIWFLYFRELGAHAKFQKSMITPSGRKVRTGEEERKKRKNTVNSGHLAPSAQRYSALWLFQLCHKRATIYLLYSDWSIRPLPSIWTLIAAYYKIQLELFQLGWVRSSRNIFPT